MKNKVRSFPEFFLLSCSNFQNIGRPTHFNIDLVPQLVNFNMNLKKISMCHI